MSDSALTVQYCKFHIVWMRMGVVVLSNYRVIIEIRL